MAKRYLEAIVITDCNLGSIQCRAKELLTYLKSTDCINLIFRGNLIDPSFGNECQLPAAHIALIDYINIMIANGTRVFALNSAETFNTPELKQLTVASSIILQSAGGNCFIHSPQADTIVNSKSPDHGKKGLNSFYDNLIRLKNTVLGKGNRYPSKFSLLAQGSAAINNNCKYLIPSISGVNSKAVLRLAKGSVTLLTAEPGTASILECGSGQWSFTTLPAQLQVASVRRHSFVPLNPRPVTLHAFN